jgi:hypothetical protein
MSNPQRSRSPRTSDRDHGGLIPPAEMFGRVLFERFIPDADMPFEERVERAWKRLLAAFEVDEHKRLREALVEIMTTKEVNDVGE